MAAFKDQWKHIYLSAFKSPINKKEETVYLKQDKKEISKNYSLQKEYKT